MDTNWDRWDDDDGRERGPISSGGVGDGGGGSSASAQPDRPRRHGRAGRPTRSTMSVTVSVNLNVVLGMIFKFLCELKCCEWSEIKVLIM